VHEVKISNTDFWFKIVDFLQQNWAVIEAEETRFNVYFFTDTSVIFDQMSFVSVEAAERGLTENGFSRYNLDRKAQNVIAIPEGPFKIGSHPSGAIYSSGQYWKSPSESRLARFESAQDPVLRTILDELAAGRKRSHWMWFFFPQMLGLGSSPMARQYGILSLEEARDYLAHPVLRERYDKGCELLMQHKGKPIREIMGSPDDLKLRSSLTLFAQATADNSLYLDVLNAFYDGNLDRKTLALLGIQPPTSPFSDIDRLLEIQRMLDIPRHKAVALGQEAVQISQVGKYVTASNNCIDISSQMDHALSHTVDIRPDTEISLSQQSPFFSDCTITVANETTLEGALRLGAQEHPVLALNFANGVHPGGGFLNGARAQEEYLCRSSGLYETLLISGMYDFHRRRPLPDSSEWIIYSPKVPIFRSDNGDLLDQPWLLSVLTSAAPVASRVGLDTSTELMKARTKRVIEVAVSLGYTRLVLGAWGCGAFGNDTFAVANAFKEAIDPLKSHFEQIHFAVTDWSSEQRFIGPFRTVFE